MTLCFETSTLARTTRALLLLFAVLYITSSSQAQQSKAQSSDVAESALQPGSQGIGDQEYLISPDDVLDVSVMDVAEMSRAFRVSPTGTVSLPLLTRPLRAAGLTLTEFSAAISQALKAAELVSNPQVTVSVQQSRLHSVAVTGAVRHPQIFPLLGKTTLLDVLSQAEGLADDAGTVALVRRGDIAIRAIGLDVLPDMRPEEREALLTVSVDTKRLMESTDPGLNIDVYPGDRVTVPRAGIVYVVGAVNRPGGFTMKPGKQGMTVLQAVALAEDVKSTAVSSKAVLLRADGQSADGRKQIPIDLKKVLAGQAGDPVLQAEDILFIPDSPGKKAIRRGLESALQMTTGLIIYRR